MAIVIDENHEAILKTLLKFEPHAALPPDIVEMYWDVERTARRIGKNLSEHELILIVMLAGRPTQADPVSFLDEHEIQTGDRVLAKYRGKWRWGRFVRHDQETKRIHVTLDEDNGEDERKFSATSVRFPTREELKSIGEA